MMFIEGVKFLWVKFWVLFVWILTGFVTVQFWNDPRSGCWKLLLHYRHKLLSRHVLLNFFSKYSASLLSWAPIHLSNAIKDKILFWSFLIETFVVSESYLFYFCNLCLANFAFLQAMVNCQNMSCWSPII